MKFNKLVFSTALLGGAIAANTAIAAVIIDDGSGINVPLSEFCANTGAGTNPTNSYRTGIYTFTCFTNGPGQTPDPAAAHMAVTNLAGTTRIQIASFSFAGVATGTLQISGYPSGVLTGSLSYYVELTPAPGFDPDENPDVRLDVITLSQEVLANPLAANTASRKQITGQNNVVVPDATFTADLNATGQGGIDTTTCGVCRKFAVTDSFNNQVNPGIGAGRIQSLSNSYDTVVPVPAPLALMAFGLIGLGAMARRRKA